MEQTLSSDGSSRKEGNNENPKRDHALNCWPASDTGLPAVPEKGCLVLCCSNSPRLLKLEAATVIQHLGSSVKISAKP